LRAYTYRFITNAPMNVTMYVKTAVGTKRPHGQCSAFNTIVVRLVVFNERARTNEQENVAQLSSDQRDIHVRSTNSQHHDKPALLVRACMVSVCCLIPSHPVLATHLPVNVQKVQQLLP